MSEAEPGIAARINETLLCANSGAICVAKVALSEQLGKDLQVCEYGKTGDVDFDSDEDKWNGDEDYQPRFASQQIGPGYLKSIFKVRVLEYDSRSKKIGCEGSVKVDTPQQDCPTRINMEQSAGRTQLLKVVRTVFKKI